MRTTTAVALLCAAFATAPAAAATPTAASPIGVHSMLYVDHPFGAKEAMFKVAAQLGASTIRLDIALSAVFSTADGPPDWDGVDQYMLLARRYHLHVLADLLATPLYMTECLSPAQQALSYRCPPADPIAWGRDAGQIAAHTRGVIDDFEIINEPDGGWSFYGTPQQYARVLAAASAAIHAANPEAHVVLGGLMDVGSYGWLDHMLATPGADALHRFDVANIHLRVPPAQAGALVAGWRRHLAQAGFHGPLWVTETGYPADPRWQTASDYRDGPTGQARWMAAAIGAMLRAGAAMVFVTERDSLGGPYASEGILQTTDPLTADPPYTPRPSFYTVRALIRGLARGGADRPA